MNLNKTAKIFAYDAGAANATFAYALELRKQGYAVRAYPRGPAVKIYDTNIRNMVDRKEPRFYKTDLIVTGLSGVHSKYELEMIKKARAKGAYKIISILDVPYNIDIRFIVDGKYVADEYMPDEIWVSATAKLSENETINRLLVEKENPYWKYVRENYYAKSPSIRNLLVKKHKQEYLLYLTEYIQEQYGKTLGFTEFSLLEAFLRIGNKIHLVKPIFIKLHPKETNDKYDSIIGKFPELNIMKVNAPIPELIYYARAIFGSGSSVFYESVLIDKPSYSLQIGRKKILNRLPANVRELVTVEEVKKVLESIF